MRLFKRMPRAAEEARRRAFENLAVADRIQMRAPKAKGEKPGVWQSLLMILERADEAKQIATEAKDAADKAARPARARAVEIIRSRSQ